jgi:endonuclease/exonuclease/phosphatase family metal-dependent hydrolase
LRWFGPGATAAGLLYVLYLLVTGGLSFSSLDQWIGDDTETAFRGEPVALDDRAERPPDRIRIATFNIEKFGDKKSSTRVNELGVDELGTIAKIVSKFDLVAIQEIVGGDGIALKRLVDLLNESGGQYAATVSEPIGEGSYFESYAFVWDQRRIELVPGSAYVVLDPGKRMHREPMVATFQTRLPSPETGQPFRFTAINVHTDPDLVDPDQPDSEINVLADVFHRVREYEFRQHREDDFILLGDLNVDPSRLGKLGEIPGLISLGGDVKTNVSRKKTNDHILIDRNVTREYSGAMGVIDLIAHLGLSREQADSISDHIPLWAEFEIVERQPAVAAAPSRPGSRTKLLE